MSNRYTASSLIQSLRLRGYIPSSSGLSSTDLLQLLSEELAGYVTATLKSVREEFLVTTTDVAVAAGETVLPIPSRAVAGGLRTVAWMVDGRPIPLDRVEPERVHRYPASGSRPLGFEFQGDSIVLIPTPSGAGTIRLGFLQRPGRLVSEDDVGLITGINTGTGEVTISSVPSTFTDSVTYDLVSGTPNFSTKAIDQSATVASNVLTFSELPATLAVGDYIALAGDTPIPSIPVEAHYLLTARVAAKIGEATGSARLDALNAGVEAAKKDLITLISPRATGSSRRIINYNGPGWGRRGRG